MFHTYMIYEVSEFFFAMKTFFNIVYDLQVKTFFKKITI